MQNKDLLLYFQSFLSIINKRNPTNIVGYERKVESMSNINISYKELKQLEKGSYQLLDMRDESNTSYGMIPGAVVAAGEDELGTQAKEYIDQGQLVPDELTLDLVMDRFKKDDCKNGYVLDGFPRTIPQAEALDKALAALGDKVDYAIDVNVPDENIVNRMGGRRACVGCGATYHLVYAPTKTEGICDVCGKELILRDDDKPETVQKRLNVYHEQTQPLIDYYTKAGILKTVDGTVDINDVFAAIVEILGA